MAKQKYYVVTNPQGKKRVVSAESKFHAGAICSGYDFARYVFKDYEIKKCK